MFKRYWVILLALPIFAACGGGGSSPPPPTGGPPPPPATEVGVFIDSPVEGLGYQSGGRNPGTTDAEGMFVYEVGQTLSFSVGGVRLGTGKDRGIGHRSTPAEGGPSLARRRSSTRANR